jgi:predicted amidohydrolase YtcJ
MRRLDIPLAFGSDLVAYDYNPFYGIYAAITRMSKEGVPEGGFFPEEKLTSEESLRGYTNWAAYAAFVEEETGTLEKGKWADIVVTDIDILNVGQDNPKDLLNGQVLMTMVGGKTVFNQQSE